MATTRTKPKTLEQRLKFDFGLTIGFHLVTFIRGENTRKARIEITSRGNVRGLMEPREGDMYASWDRIKGDKWASQPGAIKLWPTKDPEYMAQFEAEPEAFITL